MDLFKDPILSSVCVFLYGMMDSGNIYIYIYTHAHTVYSGSLVAYM